MKCETVIKLALTVRARLQTWMALGCDEALGKLRDEDPVFSPRGNQPARRSAKEPRGSGTHRGRRSGPALGASIVSAMDRKIHASRRIAKRRGRIYSREWLYLQSRYTLILRQIARKTVASLIVTNADNFELRRHA
jgi:hypothetical protein